MIAVAALAGFVALRDRLTLDALAAARGALAAWVAANPLLAPAGFVAAYVGVVGLSLPGATVMTLAGGLLFGLFPGVVWNVAGAATGACLIFLAVRMGIGRDLAARLVAGGGAAARLIAGLERNVWPVLMLMRLLPAVPFFAANLLPAFAGVRFGPYAVTTVLGILPGTLVLTSVGAGMGEVLDAGGRPDLGVFLQPQVLWPILGLCALVALPLVVRGLRRGA